MNSERREREMDRTGMEEVTGREDRGRKRKSEADKRKTASDGGRGGGRGVETDRGED